MTCNFILGTHEVHWIEQTELPFMLSRRRLEKRKRLPRALGSWVLDSGGFSELSMYGEWSLSARDYATQAERYAERCGKMSWAAIQDWMCEPIIISKTGLSVREHQQRTLDNYLELQHISPTTNWLPVLQGWTYDDYIHHLGMYEQATGVAMSSLPLVGIGSMCRRQNTLMVEELIRDLHQRGLKLHGFGFKLSGLRTVAHYLTSADSMAWSFDARRKPPLPGCPHASCQNCFVFAEQWRAKVIRLLAKAKAAGQQRTLW